MSRENPARFLPTACPKCQQVLSTPLLLDEHGILCIYIECHSCGLCIRAAIPIDPDTLDPRPPRADEGSDLPDDPFLSGDVPPT